MFRFLLMLVWMTLLFSCLTSRTQPLEGKDITVNKAYLQKTVSGEEGSPIIDALNIALADYDLHAIQLDSLYFRGRIYGALSGTVSISLDLKSGKKAVLDKQFESLGNTEAVLFYSLHRKNKFVNKFVKITDIQRMETIYMP